MTILDRIDQADPKELLQGVWRILAVETADRSTHEKLRDRRLLPTLTSIVQAKGRLPEVPPDLLPAQTENAMASAINLLGEIAVPEDAEAVQALLGLLTEGSARARLASAVALGQIGVIEASEEIVALTESMFQMGEMGAVARLVRVLAKIGGEDARTYMQNLILQGQASEDKQVRYVVAEAQASLQAINERLV